MTSKDMRSFPRDSEKLAQLAAIASSALPDDTERDDNRKQQKITSDRAVPTGSEPRYDLPSTTVRMEGIPHSLSSLSRKRPRAGSSLNSEEHHIEQIGSGLKQQSYHYQQQNHELSQGLPSSSTGLVSRTQQPVEGVRFREYQAESWSEKFEELCAFRRKYGHCHVPHYFSESFTLAQWVKRQRYQYKLKLDGKRSTLTEERIRILNKVDFIWNSHDAVWEERFQDLLAYKHVHGHCIVPSTFEANPQLAVWTKRQRRQYKRYKHKMSSSVTPSRIEKLEKAGFVWDCRKNIKIEDLEIDLHADRETVVNTDLPTSASSLLGVTKMLDEDKMISTNMKMDLTPMPRGSDLMNSWSSSISSKSSYGKDEQSVIDQNDKKVSAFLSKAIANNTNYPYGTSSRKPNIASLVGNNEQSRVDQNNQNQSACSLFKAMMDGTKQRLARFSKAIMNDTNNPYGASSSKPNMVSLGGKSEQSVMDQNDQKLAAHLSKAIMNDTSKPNMVSLDGGSNIPVETHPINRAASNTSNESPSSHEEVATRSDGRRCNLINESGNETTPSARQQKPRRTPKCDFFSFSQRFNLPDRR